MSDALKFNREDFSPRSALSSLTGGSLYVDPGVTPRVLRQSQITPRPLPPLPASLHWPPSARNFLFSFFSLFFFARSAVAGPSHTTDKQLLHLSTLLSDLFILLVAISNVAPDVSIVVSSANLA